MMMAVRHMVYVWDVIALVYRSHSNNRTTMMDNCGAMDHVRMPVVVHVCANDTSSMSR